MGVRLTRVQSSEDIFGYWRSEISFDHCYSSRKTWIRTRKVRIMVFFYFIDSGIRIKRYSHARIIVDKSIFWLYLYSIIVWCCLRNIDISWSALESISERVIPVCHWCRWFLCWYEARLVWVKIRHSVVDSYENHESKHCLKPLDTIVMVSLVLRMFHIPLQKEHNNYSSYFYICQ